MGTNERDFANPRTPVAFIGRRSFQADREDARVQVEVDKSIGEIQAILTQLGRTVPPGSIAEVREGFYTNPTHRMAQKAKKREPLDRTVCAKTLING